MHMLFRMVVLSAITLVGTNAYGQEKLPRTLPKDLSKFYDRHPLVNQNQPVVIELGATTLPFADWSMINCGYVSWSNAGDVVPLNDDHDVTDERNILPIPIGVASGVELQVQKARRGKSYDEFIEPEYPWETGIRYTNTLLYDPEAKLYRLWYYNHGDEVMEYFRDTIYSISPVAYAESKDLEHWHKPLESPVRYRDHQRTNMVYLLNEEEQDDWLIKKVDGKGVRPGYGGAFFIDPIAADGERFKSTFNTSSDRARLEAFAEQRKKPLSPMVSVGQANVVYGAVSPDGLGWRILGEPILLHDADTQTVINYDPTLERYEMFTRLFEFGRRTIARSESADFTDFPLPYTVIGTGPQEASHVDFYNNAVVYYPGQRDLRVAFVNVYDRAIDRSVIRLAVSRNGHYWDWVPGEPAIDCDDGQGWGISYIQVAPSLVRTPDQRLMITYMGTVLPHKFPRHNLQTRKSGVAYWQDDRMIALVSSARGEFTTVQLQLRGNRVYLNMATERAGHVQVQVLDEKYQPVPGRTFDDADLLVGDSLEMPVTWRGESNLSPYRDKTIYLQFRMRAAKLYAMKALD